MATMCLRLMMVMDPCRPPTWSVGKETTPLPVAQVTMYLMGAQAMTRWLVAMEMTVCSAGRVTTLSSAAVAQTNCSVETATTRSFGTRVMEAMSSKAETGPTRCFSLGQTSTNSWTFPPTAHDSDSPAMWAISQWIAMGSSR